MPFSADGLKEVDLRGVKVWLSGAVPEPEAESIHASKRDPSVTVIRGSRSEEGILGFVQAFAGLLFRYGGQLIHGCHPSFTTVLLEQARKYMDATERPSPLFLAASDYFASKETIADWSRWEKVASMKITPKTQGTTDDRDRSLATLREFMSKECNAFVAIGGQWWDDVPGRAGVPKELKLAKDRNIPCFVLGGFGGIASKFLDEEPEWYRGLSNNLSVEDNRLLASLSDISLAAGIVVSLLNRAQ
jgi:hypothetical protein